MVCCAEAAVTFAGRGMSCCAVAAPRARPRRLPAGLFDWALLVLAGASIGVFGILRLASAMR